MVRKFFPREYNSGITVCVCVFRCLGNARALHFDNAKVPEIVPGTVPGKVDTGQSVQQSDTGKPLKNMVKEVKNIEKRD